MHLKAVNLVKQYGHVMALAGLHWEVEPGQIVAVLGPNGAGKTTLLSALSGTLWLDAGRVEMDGLPLTPGQADLRKRFCFIPDSPPVQPGWTPLRFIGTLLKLYGTPREGLEQRVLELLEEMDLLEVASWSFNQLSRGQSYKAVLAGYLAADPELWLIDEPFSSGMDPRGLNCFKNYARQAIRRGRTIIFTTQIIEVAEQFAQRICVLDKGQIQHDGSLSQLRKNQSVHRLLSQLRESPSP